MNRDETRHPLPEQVARYFREVAVMQPPADLMDDVVAEIETTGAPSKGLNLRFTSLAAAAVLVIVALGAGIWALSSQGLFGPSVGTDASPSPAETASPAPIATAAPAAVDQLPSRGSVEREIEIELLYPLKAVGHGSLWLYAWTETELVRLDPETGEEQARIDLGPRPAERDLTYLDGAPTVTDDWVFVGTPDDRIVRIDPGTNELSEFATGVRPFSMTVDGDDLWAVDHDHDTVFRFEIGSGEPLAEIPVPDGPRHLTVDGDAAWVVTMAGRSLVRIDVTSNTVEAEYPLGAGASLATVLGDSVYVSTEDIRRPLERFSIPDEQIILRGAPLAHVIAHDGQLVGIDRNGHLVFVDPETLEWTAALEIGVHDRVAIVLDGDRMWVDTDAYRPATRLVRLND